MIVFHLHRNGTAQFRTDGPYTVATRADISKWEMRLLDRPTIRVYGNTLDQSDVTEMRVAMDMFSREIAAKARQEAGR